jgi:predicted acetyltransferase
LFWKAGKKMDEITLIEANLEYADELRAFRQEVLEIDAENEDRFAGCMSLEDASLSEEAWIRLCMLRKDPLTCKQAGVDVPSTTYFAIRKRDGRLVGVIDLRHHIDHPILGTWGGHCGYSVRPSERGKGYAGEMLRQNIDRAHEMGIERMLITCNETNAASENTILRNGGVFEKTIEVDGEILKRYWIDVKGGTKDA